MKVGNKNKNVVSEFKLIWEYRELLKNLVLRNLKVRYKKSVLGFFWAILNPLLMMTVMYIVFSRLFISALPHYSAYLISGLVTWNLYAQATNDAMHSFTSNGNLLKKIFLPKAIFTIAPTVSGLVNFCFSLVPMYAIFLFSGTVPSIRSFLLPFCLVELIVFSIGMSLIISTIVVFFHDASYIYEIILLAWMYLTPIFYPASILPPLAIKVLHLNPLYHYLVLFRGVLYDTSVQLQALEFHFLWGGIYAALAFALGAWIYMSNKNKLLFYL
jgi:lipopolysaccharide transport system permease protein